MSAAKWLVCGLLLAWSSPGRVRASEAVPDQPKSPVARVREHMAAACTLILDALPAAPSASHERLRFWLSTDIPVRVGLPRGFRGYTCNAFYNGRSLNFLGSDEALGCIDASSAPKVVLHEFFHGVHDHLSPRPQGFDAQVSEGVADFGAALVTGNPYMTGLTNGQEVMRARTNLRSCINDYTFCRSRRCDSFPGDEPHNAGPVLSAALWQVLQGLQGQHGIERGRQKMAELLVRFLTLCADMESAYSALIAADEDADGDPSNGTENSCLINRAFVQGGPQNRGHFPNARRHAVPCVPPAGES